MSDTNFNKIISTINSVTTDFTFIPRSDEVIVIDTSFNRIGINTVNPDEAIHVSGGTIKTTDLEIIGNVKSNIISDHSGVYNLGSLENPWKTLFTNDISGSALLNIINDISNIKAALNQINGQSGTINISQEYLD